MNKTCIAALICLCCAYGALAQNTDIDGGILRWEGSFDAGLNSDGYEFGFGILYFPSPYVGLKAAIGFAGEIERLEDWDTDWYGGYAYSARYDRDYAVRFKFSPSVVFRSPRLIHWKRQDAGFHIFAEPGIILSPGAGGSRNARSFCWSIRTGINMQIDRFIVGIGYGLSNFSLYSGSPYNENGLPSDTEHRTHSGFITAAVKF